MTTGGVAAARLGSSPMPALVERHARDRPQRVAVRQKRLGVWAELTWSGYARRVARVGLGLRALGVAAGTRVAILARNRVEWLLADLGIQGIGAVTVGVHHASPPPAVADALARTSATVLVAEDEEQLDKALEEHDRLPELRTIVVIEARGIRDLAPRGGLALVSLAELEALGETSAGEWAGLLARLVPEEPAVIAVPLGSARCVVLSHANLAAAGQAVSAAVPLGPGDDVLASPPLSEASGRLVAGVGVSGCGCVVNFGESAGPLAADLAELQPTVIVAAPRFWERLVDSAVARMAGARGVKRAAYRRLLGDDPLHRVGLLGSLVLARSLRAELGLRRARVAVSCGGALDAAARAWLRAIGVPLREAYGLSETAGVATLGDLDDTRAAGVGRPLQGVELRVAPDGEILVRGPMVSTASLDDDQAGTRAAGGWLRTGDVGALTDDGTLLLTGRTADVVVTTDAVRVTRARLEQLVTVSPYVRAARIVGEGRPYLTALVAPDPAAGNDARDLVRGVIDEVNDGLAPAVQIRRFELVADPPAEQPLAPEAYAELVEGMYAP